MKILLTNDDGIFAPGLAAIYNELVKLGDVTVVAPAQSHSGMSHSITFHAPIACNKVDINGHFSGYRVQGSPADCVKLAVMQLIDEPIDLVVAGINNGANIGINVYYSGTVAAAMEGQFLSIPSVALSLAAEKEMNFDKAAQYCCEILKSLMPIKTGAVTNINIPQLSKGPPRGVKVVPQSTEGIHEHFIEQKDDQGKTVFQLAGGMHRIEKNATDFTALLGGYITVTALTADMTNHKATKQLNKKKWPKNFN